MLPDQDTMTDSAIRVDNLSKLSCSTEPTSGRAGSLLEVGCSVSHTVVVGV
ncbi:MAG: hypothetical protein V9H69_07055 [Anaerolineae bacterium]|jgi:hypothetical protein